MEVELAGRRYEWVDQWASAPDPELTKASWPHSAIVWSRRRELWTFHPAKSAAIAFDPEGRFLRSVPSRLSEAHGITLVEEHGTEYLWIADASGKRRAEDGYQSQTGSANSLVVKVDLQGEVVTTLPSPDHPAYETGRYAPTWVGVNEERFGGNGDVWVADGYGQSLVHRFGSDGKLLATLTGEEGAGRFRGPHIAFVDRRRANPELYIADRGNSRIQVYDLKGRFRRVVGAGFLSSPTAFAVDGARLLVMEFNPPRLMVLDAKDRLAGMVGENLRPLTQPGFPFVRSPDGQPAIPAGIGSGKFGVPHSVATDDKGNLYFAEVVFGSRFTKLRRLRS
ncbi:MAG TPA: hypothetical protein VGS18_02255 [Thermoplasmata archaeon]|nr:hypothetical protein [Thermoplasmata archaeon]